VKREEQVNERVANENHTRMVTDEQSLLEKQIPLPALVEGLLFVADEPVTVARLAQALEMEADAVEAALNEISADGVNRGVRLQRKGDRVQLVTRPEAAAYIERFMGLETSGRLSQAALETLSIVAYRQPCTRSQIEVVRGVNCDSVLRNLLSKGLIEESGRQETVGHPFLYSTTFAFLQHFGLRSLNELPPLEPMQTPTLVEPDTVTAGAPDEEISPTEVDVMTVAPSAASPLAPPEAPAPTSVPPA
jgi:segregation and condensation protein B